jgi:hypothetical protein
MKRLFYVLVLLIAVSLMVVGRRVPGTIVRHPILTLRAMHAAPIGTHVLPLLNESLWCREYGWGCGHAATVVGYRLVREFDGRPLLVYLIRTDSTSPVVMEVHPMWVEREGF